MSKTYRIVVCGSAYGRQPFAAKKGDVIPLISGVYAGKDAIITSFRHEKNKMVLAPDCPSVYAKVADSTVNIGRVVPEDWDVEGHITLMEFLTENSGENGSVLVKDGKYVWIHDDKTYEAKSIGNAFMTVARSDVSSMADVRYHETAYRNNIYANFDYWAKARQ